ncbi:DUF6924 domain-containing protein [Streptomyces sp. NPDC088354]|uniref:DUF6924 domain-containing protein n=1 Tax=Streptomyces sp. NPDC088354 TaxID=3365856 RepID=UPI0037F187E5
MVALSALAEHNELAAVIFRTDFTDEVGWREVIAELERTSFDDEDPGDTFEIVGAPELDGSDPDAVLAAVAAQEKLRDQLRVVFVADATTVRPGHHALLAITTRTRDECEDDEEYTALTEFGRAFRTVPRGVHSIHANLEVANMGFEEYAALADADPEGVYRDYN